MVCIAHVLGPMHDAHSHSIALGGFDAFRATLAPDHLFEHLGVKHPCVRLLATLSQRIFEALIGTSTEAIHGKRKAGNDYLTHVAPNLYLNCKQLRLDKTVLILQLVQENSCAQANSFRMPDQPNA